MQCPICQTRKPRRQCPGVHGDICSICCGSEREVSISCPLDCPYLREARTREKAAPMDPRAAPNSDIEVPARFLNDHREAALMIGLSLSEGIDGEPDAVDRDVRDALDSLIRTYRSLVTGVYYESHPVNPYAGRIYKAVRALITAYPGKMRDGEVLGVLVLLQRMALNCDNGRPKCRAFIDFLGMEFKALRAAAAAPAEPRLIEL